MRKTQRDPSAATPSNLNLSLGNAVGGVSNSRNVINSARSSSCARERGYKGGRNPPRSARAINPEFLYPNLQKGPIHVQRSSISGTIVKEGKFRKQTKQSKSKNDKKRAHCKTVDSIDGQERPPTIKQSEKSGSRPPFSQARLQLNMNKIYPLIPTKQNAENPSVHTAGGIQGKVNTPRSGSNRGIPRLPSRPKLQKKISSPRESKIQRKVSRKSVKNPMNKENESRNIGIGLAGQKRASSFIQEPLQGLISKQNESLHSHQESEESLSGISGGPILSTGSAAQDLMKHLESENIILYPNSGAPNVFKTFRRKHEEIKPEYIIPYQEQHEQRKEEEDERQEVPPKLATRERAEEERKEEEIERIQQQIEAKWKQLKIPKLDRIHFKRLFFFQETSLPALTHQLELLETYKQMASIIIVKILEREKLLKYVKELSGGVKQGDYMRNFETELLPLFLHLRTLNLAICEMICLEWRSILWLPQPFMWEEQNYMEKILEDYKELLNSGNPIIRKMLIFVEDMLFFKPRKHDDILSKLTALIDIQQPVALEEVQFFHRICSSLKANSENSRIKAAQNMLQQEQNCQKQLIEENQKMKESGEFTPFLRWKPPAYKSHKMTVSCKIIEQHREDSFEEHNPESWQISPIAPRDQKLITLGNVPNIEGSGAFSLSDGAGSRAGDLMYMQNGSGGVDLTLEHRSSSLCINSQENAVESTASFSGVEPNLSNE